MAPGADAMLAPLATPLFITLHFVSNLFLVLKKFRLLWLASITSSLILSYFITKEVYQKLKSSEIVVTMEGSSIRADQIPFPAVTLTRNLFKEYDYNKFIVAYGMPTDEEIEKLNNVK